MTKDELNNIQSRVDAKLRYAFLHLEEMMEKGIVGGDDFDRAHQESFLFHLLGVKDAFLIELCKYYGIDRANQTVTLGWLRCRLREKQVSSTELSEIYTLENEEGTWLSNAKSIRDHSMHDSNVARHFHLGGENHQKVFISVPKTGEIIKKHINDEFHDWLNKMQELINKLRISALNYYNSRIINNKARS